MKQKHNMFFFAGSCFRHLVEFSSPLGPALPAFAPIFQILVAGRPPKYEKSGQTRTVPGAFAPIFDFFVAGRPQKRQKLGQTRTSKSKERHPRMKLQARVACEARLSVLQGDLVAILKGPP